MLYFDSNLGSKLMFITLKNERKKKIWIPQIENLGIIFKCSFRGDDKFFEWSDVLKICTLGGGGFIIRIQRGGRGSKYSIFCANILIIETYHKG